MRKEGIVQGWDARRRLALAAQQAAAGSCSDSDKRRAGTISFEPLTPSWPAFAAALADCAFVAIALVVAYAAADPEDVEAWRGGGRAPRHGEISRQRLSGRLHGSGLVAMASFRVIARHSSSRVTK